MWIFIYLLYESQQGNHISHGCTVTVGLLNRILALLGSPRFSSTSLSPVLYLKLTRSLFFLIRAGPGRSHEIFSAPDVSK